jgi:hypothetical protein
MTKLISVVRQSRGSKAYTATFEKDGKTIKRRFGTNSNYTVASANKTAADRDAFHARHSKVKGANYSDPTTPASLSRFILWGDSRSLAANVRAYKKKYSV